MVVSDNPAHITATNTAKWTEITGQDDDEIPEWVTAECRTMSREVTPPEQFYSYNQEGRQDGDCGPAAVIGTLYYIYCKAGVKRVELESLLAYRAIRQFAATHLQQQTILEVAQVDADQMVGCQAEVHRATQDLWTQITSWNVDTNTYASTAAWVWHGRK